MIIDRPSIGGSVGLRLHCFVKRVLYIVRMIEYWLNIAGMSLGFIGGILMFWGAPKIQSGTFFGGGNTKDDASRNRKIR